MNNNRPRHHPHGGAARGPSQPPNFAHQYTNSFHENLNLFHQNPNLFLPNPNFTSYSAYRSFSQNPAFSFPPHNYRPNSGELLQKVERAVTKAQLDILAAGESVSSWKVSQSSLLSLQIDSWSSLGFQLQDVPPLYRLMVTEGKVNAFIHCFVGARRITSIYDLDIAICKSEGVDHFEELGLGPLLRHPLIEHYFLVPSDLKEFFKITSDEIISSLVEFMDTGVKYVKAEEFLYFLSKSRSVYPQEKLGVRIQSLGMHVGFIIEAKKAEKAILVNYLQTLKHSSVKQSKEQERESSQPCSGTLSLKQGLDRRFNAISERIRLFSTSSRFRGKHIRFEPPSSEDENIEDDDTDSDEHGNNDSNIQYQNSLKNMMEAEQRVSSCPYPSAAEEMLRLGLKVEMDGNATPGCGKSDVGKKKSGQKRKSENQYRSVKDREDDEVSLDSQRMKKMQRCSKEKNQDLSKSFNVVPSPQEQHLLYQSANRSTLARRNRRKYKRQSGCDYQVKFSLLEHNTMESFITTWRDTCRKHSVVEIFGKMSKFYNPNRKRLPKYSQEELGVALINVAVTSIKWGMWDSLCDTGQPIGQHKLTGPSSVQPTEMIDNGCSSKRDFALSKNQHAREAGFSVTVDDIFKEVAAFFDLELVTPMVSEGKVHIQKQLLSLKVILDCEKWLKKKFSVNDFCMLGHGDFVVFLQENISVLPYKLCNVLSYGDICGKSPLEVSMLQNQLLLLLAQAANHIQDDVVITNQQISSLLEKQFPFISFGIRRNGPEEDILGLIREQGNSEASSTVMFSTTLLGESRNGDALMQSGKYSSELKKVLSELGQGVGCLGTVSNKDAIECLLKAPMLSDLQSWSHWEYIYAPSLGPLLGWLLNQVHTKDLLCILTRDGKLIRIDPTVNVDSFLEASLQGSAYQTAVKLLSLLSVYRGTNRAPLSLLKRYAVHAIEVITRNSTENTKVKDNNKASTKHTMLDVDAKGTSLTLQSHEGFCTTNREVVVASRFVLDCLTFLPPEFRSYAADILLSGLRSLNKNAPAIILRECNQTDQLLMLHDIGMSLGILEWIEDYSVFNSATAGNLFTSNGTLKNLCDTSPSLIIKSTPDTLDKLLSPDDKVMASEAQTHLLDGNHKASAEKLQESEVPNDVPVEKSGEGSGSLVLKGSHEDEAVRVIESIRSEEFGLGPNLKVAESSLMKKQHARLGRALHCLSQELYSQDSHFLLELIQNADDNIYLEGVDPSLVFILQDTGITVLNNERGFSAQNIRALCDVGNSTKKGSGAGYIGQKGIGFKSVFRVTDAPEIHSNGFHVKFDISEDQIGFVLPTVISPCSIDWFMCLLSPEIDQPDAACWNTCIVLPFRSKLKGDGLGSIVSMFSDLHPSLLLFLHRLQCIKFKNVLSNSLTIMRKETVGNGIVKVSYGEEVMSWLVASQKLQANVIRSDVQTTEISVAFTLQESNSGGYKPYLKQQPVFAFLPLRTYGMKFILQGDFVLPSSREEVDGDSAWNQWLLSEFPALFVRAEKSFYGLPCFQDSPGKAVTAYMSFVPLIGEVHGFFSHMPHMIISELRMSSCLLLDGSDSEWVPPCRVLRGWNEQTRILLPERLLQKHLGLGYLNKDIILSDPLAKALGIQDYGPKILCAFITSICHTDNGINSFGLSWLCSWISALYTMLPVHSSGRQAAETEGDIVQCLRKVPFIPLSDGSFGSLAEGPIWLPCDSTAVESKSTHNPKDFPNLYANLRTVNPALLSEATTNTYCLEEIHADTIIQMLCRVGVQQLSAHEVIKSHILRAMSEDISTRDKHLMTDYLSFLMLHLQSACPSCNIERAEIISELQRKPIVLTNHGYKCLSVEPVHFSRKFGNFVDIQQLIDDKNTQWHEIDSIYLRHPCIQSLSLGLKNWRDFLQELGVTDFVQIIKKKVADVSDTISQNMMSGGGDLLQSAIVVEDWESPELVDLLSTLTSDMCVGKCKYLLEILDKMWDDNFSAKVISYSVLKSTKEQKAFQSSFLKTIHNFSWIASSMDEVLHYPKDVFFDCEAVRSILGDIAPYAVPQVTNKALLNAIGFKTRVTLDDGLIILKQWRTLRVPFRTSIAQMSKFYTFVWDEITASKRNITEFTSESFIFFPLAVTSRREDVIAGEFLSPKEVFWHDPTGCIDRMKEVVLHSSTENVPSNTMLAHVYPTLYDFFVNDCGVPKVPPFHRYLQILLQFSSVALPSHAENTVYRVLLKWADDLMSGMVGNEEISYLKGCLQKLENTVFPTVQDKWVSLHPSFGLVCWSDDEELMKQFKHSKNIDFLYFGELSDEEKNTLSAKFPALMKTIGVPSLSELVSREAIFYGMEDSTEKASLLNWVLPYAQRYIYKMHPNRYAHLTESGYEGLSQLRVVVVEKLYYRLSIKGCENTSKKRIECSSLLQENTLYVTRASDSHTIFLELSRFFFNGSVELHFANFLHMIATMAESGSTEEQTEFFIVNSQKVPKLLDEENVWSISCLSLPNEDATSQPASSLLVTNENNPSKPKRKPDTGTNWPPTGWKTAPDFHFACRTKPLFTPNAGLQNGVPETEQVIHTEDWHVPIEITDDWTLDQSTAVVSQGSRTRKDEALLLGCAGTAGKVVNSSLEMLTELPDLGIVTDLGSGISTFTTRDQLLFSADENQALRTGRLGELLAYKYFVEKLGPAAVRWVNEVTETGLPFDLVVRENEESKEFIEVKATKSIYKNWFTISTREWKFACERGDSFSVAHIVLADPKNAKITIFKNPVKLCQQDVLNLAILMSKQQKEASTPVTYGGKC